MKIKYTVDTSVTDVRGHKQEQFFIIIH